VNTPATQQWSRALGPAAKLWPFVLGPVAKYQRARNLLPNSGRNPAAEQWFDSPRPALGRWEGALSMPCLSSAKAIRFALPFTDPLNTSHCSTRQSKWLVELPLK
jgi:hypothetical protein